MAARDGHGGAGDPRGHPVSPRRRHGRARRRHPPVLRRARLRRRPARPARQRRVRRHPHRRVCRPGTEGPARGHRLDRRAALVRRQRRDDGHFVGRLQQPPVGRPPSTGSEGHHHAHVDGRPLRRRRPLQGRLRARHRPAPLEQLHAALAMPAAPRGRRRRAVARDVARAPRGQPALGAPLARAPAPRRLLEARLRVRGLRRDRGPRVRDRWLDRRLHQFRPPPARRSQGTAQGVDRALAARLPARRGARARGRLPAGGAALVGPLAQGRAERYRRRTDVPGLDAGLPAAGAASSSSSPAAGSPRSAGHRR